MWSMIKQLFCIHKYKYSWLNDFWFDDGVLIECEKCKKVKELKWRQ